MAISWGDIPTWLAAIGTTSAVSVALLQSRVQSRTAQARSRRHQAEQVSGWYGGDLDGRSDLVFRNGSEHPIHEVVVSLTLNGVPAPPTQVGGDEFRRVFLVLPPGTFRLQVSSGWHGMHRRPGVEISFTDGTGEVHWIRRANGVLEESQVPAIERYNLARPYDYDVAHPLPSG